MVFRVSTWGGWAMTSMCQPFNKKASTRYGQKLPLLSAVRALSISLSIALNQISTLFWGF